MLLAIVFGGACIFLATCKGKSTPSTPTGATIYTVRGQVVELPDPANLRSGFRVHHEAIRGFKDAAGKVVGMNEMTMEFRPGQPEVLQGLAKGDKVEMVFESWPAGEPPMRYLENRVTQIRKLPADTTLEFKAQPSGN